MFTRTRAADTFALTQDERHGPLVPLLLVLTMVTGLVDSVSYLKLGHVSVANTTGNVVFLGLALVHAEGFSMAASLTAIGAFLVGALAGGRISVRQGHHRARHLAIASAVQLVLVGAALLVFNVGVTAVLALAMVLLGLNGIAAYRVSSSSAGWTAPNTTAEHRSVGPLIAQSARVSQPQFEADMRAMDQIAALRPDLLRIREIYMSVVTMGDDETVCAGAELAA